MAFKTQHPAVELQVNTVRRGHRYKDEIDISGFIKINGKVFDGFSVGVSEVDAMHPNLSLVFTYDDFKGWLSVNYATSIQSEHAVKVAFSQYKANLLEQTQMLEDKIKRNKQLLNAIEGV